MACCLLIAACTVEDGDAAGELSGFEGMIASDGSRTIIQGTGRWVIVVSNAVAESYAAQDYNQQMEPEYSSFMAQGSRIVIGSMPNASLLNAIGLEGWQPDSRAPYFATCREKGYSKNTVVFQVDMPDYEFTCRKGAHSHVLTVQFGSGAELAVDHYLGTALFTAKVKTVRVDGELRLSDGWMICLEVGQQY
ncbi:MAG: hypothetical protein IJT98_11455 [Prevotella sp.]|nr:hypothetical protein [Prevotella sp.]